MPHCRDCKVWFFGRKRLPIRLATAAGEGHIGFGTYGQRVRHPLEASWLPRLPDSRGSQAIR